MRTSARLGAAVGTAVALLAVPADAGLPPPMRTSVQPVEKGERPRVRVHIPVPAGVEDPAGRVLVEVVRWPGGAHHDQRRRAWSGTDLGFTLDRVGQPGRYLVRARFTSASESMRDASAQTSFRVRR